MINEVPRTREQGIENAAKALAHCRATQAQMTPREQAEAAWTPTSPYSVDELEDLIRHRRGMTPAHCDALAFADLLARQAIRIAELTGGGHAEVRHDDGT